MVARGNIAKQIGGEETSKAIMNYKHFPQIQNVPPHQELFCPLTSNALPAILMLYEIPYG